VEPPPVPPNTPQPRAEAPAPAPAPEPAAVAVADPPAGGLELGTVSELWPAVVDAVRADDDVLAMCLTEARPVDCAERSLVIAFHPDDTMRRRKAESVRARQVVAEALRSLTGVAPQISVEARELDPAVVEAPADPEAELLERLKAEFDAEEILDDPDQEGAA
jgi:DNA polymerase-3 subunit gamma/tau